MQGYRDDKKIDKDKIEKSLKIAELLIKNGCPVNSKNKGRMTALMLALTQVGQALFR